MSENLNAHELSDEALKNASGGSGEGNIENSSNQQCTMPVSCPCGYILHTDLKGSLELQTDIRVETDQRKELSGK